MAQIEDLIAAYTLGTISGMDTGKVGGNKDVNLKDPNVYTTLGTTSEPAPLPEGALLEERGSGLNKRQVLVGADVKDNDPIGRFLGGFADLILQDITDFDKRGNIRGEEHTKGLRPGSGYGKEWDQEKENKLALEKVKADLGGDALPSPEQTRKSIETRRVQDDYTIERLKELNDYELERVKDAYPQYAKMINDEIFYRRMQIEYNSPREITERINASRRGYVDALTKRAAAQSLIADATSKGLTFKAG
tara:strand:+ start:920 stop:1666 length:747 start_codon:yes stop_codon:yes gene_type:complete